MFRSPQKLRSGTKGKPVQLSAEPCDKPADKKKLQRSLSVSSASAPKQTTMPDKEVDPAEVERCVNSYLTSEDVVSRLVARLAAEMRTVVEAAVQAALTTVNQEVQKLREEVTTLTTRLRELDSNLADKTDDIEQYQRRNNLRIFGLEESAKEDTDQLVVALCKEKLGVDLPLAAICRSHRVGKQPQPTADGRGRHRAVIVKFVSYRDRQRVYSAKKNLKSTGVTLREDLTARRMEVFRRATERHGVRSTWTQDGRVLWLDGDGRRGMATHLADLEPAK